MEITQVRVFPVDEDKLKAFASIVIDACFVVGDIKVIEGPSGLFISMPSRRRKDGSFRDIAHPLNSETRRRIEERVIGEYREVLCPGGRRGRHPGARSRRRRSGAFRGRARPGSGRGAFAPLIR